jgi:hypothetical protein
MSLVTELDDLHLKGRERRQRAAETGADQRPPLRLGDHHPPEDQRAHEVGHERGPGEAAGVHGQRLGESRSGQRAHRASDDHPDRVAHVAGGYCA